MNPESLLDQLRPIARERLDRELRRRLKRYERKAGTHMSAYELPSGEIFLVEYRGAAPTREKLLAAMRAYVDKIPVAGVA